MFELKHLTTGYGNRIVTPAINATLVPGELTSLLGPNGVGKSTLLRTLSTFLSPIQGEIILQGKVLKNLSASQLSRLIGVVLTERPDVQNMTVRDMVGMGRSPYTGFWGRLTSADEQYVSEAMKLAGIMALERRMFNTLSDGERQKVMIAKVLAQQTPVILLDEPTAFLDFPERPDYDTLCIHSGLFRDRGNRHRQNFLYFHRNLHSSAVPLAAHDLPLP